MGREKISLESEGYHDNISFLASLITILAMLYLGMKYINSAISYEQDWATFAFVHMGYAIVGGLVAPLIFTGTLKPTKKVDPTSFLRAVIIFVANVWYQKFVFSLSITGTDRLIYHLFSAVSEELFYRGFLINLFERIFQELSWGKWIGVFISAVLFMAGHLSYWGDSLKLLAVFGGGLIFGIFYAIWRDLTALMVAHMTINGIGSGNITPQATTPTTITQTYGNV